MIRDRLFGSGGQSERKRAAQQSVRSVRKSRRKRRLEREAQQRKQRAQVHLDRTVRKAESRGVARHPRHRRAWSTLRRRSAFAALFGAACVIGAVLAKPLTLNASEWWNSAPVLVRGVAVQGILRLSAFEVASTIDFTRGMRLEQVDLDALKSKLSEHPWISRARVALLPDGSLIARIDERRPVATLRASREDEVFLVDAGGVVFSPAKGEITEGLPSLVQTHRSVALTRTADDVLARAARLASSISNREFVGLASASLQLPDPAKREGWVLRSADGQLKVVLGEESDREIALRLDRLKALLATDLWAGPPVGRIDLRFAERAILHASVDL